MALGDATAAEIARLAPKKVFLVGLEPALADQVSAALPGLSPDAVVSLVGTDRYGHRTTGRPRGHGEAG